LQKEVHFQGPHKFSDASQNGYAWVMWCTSMLQ